MFVCPFSSAFYLFNFIFMFVITAVWPKQYWFSTDWRNKIWGHWLVWRGVCWLWWEGGMPSYDFQPSCKIYSPEVGKWKEKWYLTDCVSMHKKSAREVWVEYLQFMFNLMCMVEINRALTLVMEVYLGLSLMPKLMNSIFCYLSSILHEIDWSALHIYDSSFPCL